MPRIGVNYAGLCRDEFVFAITLADPDSIELKPAGAIRMGSILSSAKGYVGKPTEFSTFHTVSELSLRQHSARARTDQCIHSPHSKGTPGVYSSHVSEMFRCETHGELVLRATPSALGEGPDDRGFRGSIAVRNGRGGM